MLDFNVQPDAYGVFERLNAILEEEECIYDSMAQKYLDQCQSRANNGIMPEEYKFHISPKGDIDDTVDHFSIPNAYGRIVGHVYVDETFRQVGNIKPFVRDTGPDIGPDNSLEWFRRENRQSLQPQESVASCFRPAPISSNRPICENRSLI